MKIRITQKVLVGIMTCVVCGLGINVDKSSVKKIVVREKQLDPRNVVRFSYVEQHVYYAHADHHKNTIEKAVEKAEVVLEEVKMGKETKGSGYYVVTTASLLEFNKEVASGPHEIYNEAKENKSPQARCFVLRW